MKVNIPKLVGHNRSSTNLAPNVYTTPGDLILETLTPESFRTPTAAAAVTTTINNMPKE